MTACRTRNPESLPVPSGIPYRASEQACDAACQCERRGQTAQAEAAYLQAIAFNGSNYRAHFLYSHLLLFLRRHEEAEREARAAFQLNVNEHAHRHLIDVLAQRAFALANYDDIALINFVELTAVAEKLIAMGARDQAESILRFPLELGQLQRGALVLVRMLLKLGRAKDADAVIAKIRQSDADSPWAAICEGFLALARDDESAAAQRLVAGLSRGIECAEAVEQMLIFADGQDTMQRRLAAYRDLQRCCGEHEPHIAARLAACYHATGEHVAAARLCEELTRCKATRPDGLDMPLTAPEGTLDYTDAEFRARLEQGECSRNLFELLNAPERIRTVVAINFWGRSGSFLLSSMFDGHPQVLEVLPAHSMINVMDLVLCEFRNHGSITLLVNNILSHFASHTWGGCWDALPEERAGMFAEALEHGLARLTARGYLNPAMAFRVVHIAYAVAADLKIDGDPIIAYQSHNGMKAKREQLDALVPAIRFITCVRYPERTYDSHVHLHYHEMPLGDPFYVSNMLFQWLVDMGEEVPALADDSRSVAIRFEDLHQATEVVMRSLAEWLQLRWHPCLLESTESGRAWSMASKRSGGVNSGTRRLAAKDFRTAMSFWCDRQKLRLVLAENYCAWGYESPQRRIVPRGWRALFTRSMLLTLPSKMHLIAFKDGLHQLGLVPALRKLREAHRGMRMLLLCELERRQSEPPRLFKLAYPLASVPEDVRYPQEA